MQRLNVQRHPGRFVATLILVAIAHFMLCYPAATSRGYPTIGPFWEIIALYIMFPAVCVAPVFDDFENAPRRRWRILGWFSFAMASIFAVALTNLHDVRPHIGHLAGYFGVLQADAFFVTGNTIRTLVIAVPFIVCMESVGRGFWSLFRAFRIPDTVGQRESAR